MIGECIDLLKRDTYLLLGKPFTLKNTKIQLASRRVDYRCSVSKVLSSQSFTEAFLDELILIQTDTDCEIQKSKVYFLKVDGFLDYLQCRKEKNPICILTPRNQKRAPINIYCIFTPIEDNVKKKCRDLFASVFSKNKVYHFAHSLGVPYCLESMDCYWNKNLFRSKVCQQKTETMEINQKMWWKYLCFSPVRRAVDSKFE